MPKENLKQFFSIISVLKVLIKKNLMINWSTLNTFPPYRQKKYRTATNLSWLNNLGKKLCKNPNSNVNLINYERQKARKKNSTETKRNLTILKKTKTNYFSNLNLNVVQKQSPEVFYNKRCRHFLLKNRLWHRCFPMNLTNFLEHRFYRTPPDGCFLLLVIIKNFD